MVQTTFHCPKCGSEISAEPSSSPLTACPVCGNGSLIPPPGIKPGTLIDGFRIISFLGAGGMGEVWLAEQLSMKRKVALKILSPSLTNEPEFIDRFKHEIKMAGMLEHPNIATAFHAGSSGGIHYLAISYINGTELSDRIRMGSPLSEREALDIAKSVAQALKFAWDKHKMLHRDIKPSNIMIEPNGTVKIMDLGLSKCISEKIRLTMTGVTVGTPDYMSPEQALGAREIDCRADIYSLGATLFLLTTSRLPFEGDSPLDIATKHITEELVPPKQINPKLSDGFSELIQIMMAKDMNERQSDWDNVIMDLERVSAGYPPAGRQPLNAVTVQMQNSAAKLHAMISTEKIPLAKKASSSYGKKTAFIISALLIVLLAIGGVITGILFLQKKQSKQRSPETKATPPEKKSPDKIQIVKKQPQPDPDKEKKKKEDAISSTIKKLKERSLLLFSEKKFEDAVSAYTDYNGPWAQETLELRKELAKACVEKYQKFLEKQERKKNEKEKAEEKSFIKIAKEILRGNIEQAHKSLPASPEDGSYLSELKKIQEELLNKDKFVLNELSSKTGKKIAIRTKKGTIEGKLKKVDCSNIFMEKKIGKALFVKKISFKKLSPLEIREILSQRLSPEAYSVYLATEAIKNKDFNIADSALKNAGQLSRPLRKTLLFMQPEQLSAAIKKDYTEIQTLCKQTEDDTLPAQSIADMKKHLNIKIKHFREKYAITDEFPRYDKLLKAMADALKEKPATSKKQEIKKNPPHQDSSPDISLQDLNKKLLMKNKYYQSNAKFTLDGNRIIEADFSKCRISDISPLQGLQLKKLSLPESVSDLAPLVNMPLENLKSESRVLSHLESLRGMPLVELYIKAELSDISYLKGLKLQYLYLANSNVSDLTPLERMPLTHLYLPDSTSDLSPLKDMPLQELFIPHSRVKDLSPLEGMPLERLDLMNTRITDLNPLGGMERLQELNLFGCTKLKNLKPLMNCNNLEKLVIPKNLSDKSGFLRKHPSLKYLDANWPPRPVKEFWRENQ
jgi:serine/threonine protein kinase/DNA-directed RNA polymerase subunit RPC12/RpoP